MAESKPPASPPSAPNLTDKGADAKSQKEARLAEALRANLRKRKQQTRTRKSTAIDAPPASGETDES